MSLHHAAPSASAAAQPLGDGVATERRAPSAVLPGMAKRGKAQGNPNPGLPCSAAGVAGPGEAGEGARGAPAFPGTQQHRGTVRGSAQRCSGRVGPACRTPGWSWKEDRSSFPATIFQVHGDCRRGREERGAGFVCLAQTYALKQITENAAEGSSKAEFGTDKSRGRLSLISDAGHVFVFPFPILAFPINH